MTKGWRASPMPRKLNLTRLKLVFLRQGQCRYCNGNGVLRRSQSACGMHALTRRAMDEHDDDLEPEVDVAAEQESESFPATGDELNDVATDQPADGDEDPPLDEDSAEI